MIRDNCANHRSSSSLEGEGGRREFQTCLTMAPSIPVSDKEKLSFNILFPSDTRLHSLHITFCMFLMTLEVAACREGEGEGGGVMFNPVTETSTYAGTHRNTPPSS